MRHGYITGVGDLIDTAEWDITLRTINWAVDVYIFTDKPRRALRSKWTRAAYLQGGY